MSKDPAFLFYPGDYLGGTHGMTFEQKGAYVDLLMLQFNRGHMTSHMVGQVVGQLWDGIKDKFILDQDGLWYNKRLDIEKEKRKAFVNTRVNNINGKNQYTKKQEKETGHMIGHMGGHMTTHMEDENEDVNINVNKDIIINKKINFSFEEFWMAYDKKIGDKVKLEKKWIALSDEDRKLIMEYIPKYKLSQPDKKFRKHPDTFFNNKSWHDELIQQTKVITEDGRPIDPSGHVWATKTRRY